MRSERNSSFYRPAIFLQALANERRLHVLCLLVEKEWDVTSLASEVGLSQSALSQHLAKLRSAGLVSVRKEAQTAWYSCSTGLVADTLSLMAANFRLEVGQSEAA